MTFRINPLAAIDSYKLAHKNAYPEGATEVYSNFTPRSVRHLQVPSEFKTNKIVWFGAQAVLTDMMELWYDEFFNMKPKAGWTTKETNIEQHLRDFRALVAPFRDESALNTDHFRALFNLGYLPLEIKILEEGSLVDVNIPVLTIRNTHPDFAWLTNYVETYLSAELWKMSTSATIAHYYRKIGETWAERTGGNKDFIDFQFHDFSYRGMSSSIDAAKSGSGHLLSFKGTDSIPSVDYLNYHYFGKETFIGASVPATEHSVQCAYMDDKEYIRKLVTEIYPSGIISIVSDGYDYWNVLTNILPELKEEILARTYNSLGFSKVVIRPDSGDPVRIICGYDFYILDDLANLYDFVSDKYWADEDLFWKKDQVVKVNEKYYLFEITTYPDGGVADVTLGKELIEVEVKGSIEILYEIFGGTENELGYATLSPRIGLIYGDSITLVRADEILRRLADKGFASDNVVFGVGSYTYQYNTRDTLGFAMKATNITINGEDIALFKDPKTDDGLKKSAKGLLCVKKDNGTYTVKNDVTREEEQSGELRLIYKDSVMYNLKTLEEIRNTLKGN